MVENAKAPLTPLWFFEKVRGFNQSLGTIYMNRENNENRPMEFPTFVSLSSEPEMSQDPGLGQMRL